MKGLHASVRDWVCFGLLATAPVQLRAQAQDQEMSVQALGMVSFAFERPGLPVPKFTMHIGEDGLGVYQGEEMPPASPYPGVSTPAEPINRGFTVSAATAHKIFALARELDKFNIACASKAKNIADTGKKTLVYKGADGGGSCTYNYSESKGVTQLTAIFQGIAETMDMGRKLDHLHRYDRLGLDAALGSLTDEVSAGRALEVGTIEPSLRSIANDAEVMTRARTKATTLLALIPPESSQEKAP